MLLSFSLQGVVGQHCKKILEKNKLKEEGFILTHGFRDLSPWLAGSIAFSHHGWEGVPEQSGLPHGGQEAQ
jgi:hypothetical protein